MPDAYLVPTLVTLRSEFNRLNPDRDKRTDGWIADAEHVAGGTSKHIPDAQGRVRALDVDKTGPWGSSAVTFDSLVGHVVQRHRTNDLNCLQNVIWNRRIASESWGWTWRDYIGSNAHTEHGHFEARLYDFTGSFGLVTRFGDDMTKEEFIAFFRDAVKDPAVRLEMARAIATTDNVVRLDGAAGQPADAGLQSLVRWPGAGWMEKVKDQVNGLESSVRSSQTATLDALATIIDKLNEGDNPPDNPPTSTTAAAKSSKAR
jgi:hypothetical protein